MTPHPGEFARLTGSAIGSTDPERADAARQFATDHRVVLVLKGAGTIVTDGGELFVNSTGNCGMATGGSGDVLTGLMAALIAQKMSPLAAARLGVYVHGLAGDLAADALTEAGMIASDVLEFLPPAWRKMESVPERSP